jgi:RNA polymerase sigma-70 factor (ECF subfamily)
MLACLPASVEQQRDGDRDERAPATEGTARVLDGPRSADTAHIDPLDAVLRRAQSGHEGSFMDLWNTLQPPLLRYLRLRAPGHDEDVASETWLQVVKGIGQFPGDAADFRRWVFTLARNRSIDAARSRQRRPVLLLPGFADLPHLTSPSAEQQALQQLSTDQALAMLATLPAEHAEMLALRILADLDVATVAQITGRTPGAVRVICHRALKTLAAHAPTSRAEVS